jgi:SAM-dependent methyltransferase
MYLRNSIIIASTLMIGFCLSLYFATSPEIGSMNWDQYKTLDYNLERSHSLEDLNRKIAPLKMEEIIREIYDRNHLAGEKTRVMEIGTGNGRVLMQLKKKFPGVEFYGINKEKTHTFYRKESYILTALKFEIMTKPELESMDLPYIVFADLDFGNAIPYADNKFDLVFSQDTMKFIKYKFELWNEILRILKLGGQSLHADVTGLNIYDKGLVIERREALGEMKKQGFHIKSLENSNTVLFKKSDINKNIFPTSPHHPIPTQIENLSAEQRNPHMGYNLSF